MPRLQGLKENGAASESDTLNISVHRDRVIMNEEVDYRSEQLCVKWRLMERKLN